MSFKQTKFFDSPVAGFPGQLVNSQTVSSTTIRGYLAEQDIPMGRAVIKGTIISDDPSVIRTPYKIQLPLSGVSVGSDVLGVAIRPYVPTDNVSDGAPAPTQVAGYLTGDMAAILSVKSQELIYVQVPSGETIVAGSAVRVVINTIGGTLGSFTNLNSANTSAIPGAIFFEDRITNDDDRTVAILLGIA